MKSRSASPEEPVQALRLEARVLDAMRRPGVPQDPTRPVQFPVTGRQPHTSLSLGHADASVSDPTGCAPTWDDLRHSEAVLGLRVSLRHGRAELGEALADRSIRTGQQARAAPARVAEQASAPPASSLPSWTSSVSGSRLAADGSFAGRMRKRRA
jgi:hypothetical protein